MTPRVRTPRSVTTRGVRAVGRGVGARPAAPRALVATAAPLVPSRGGLVALRRAAAGCRACPLWKLGTQTVFGEGAAGAEVVFVGEQPGNDEDLAGRPFVGPAGRVLDRALAEVGIARERTYVTNAVKHFKWKAAGKRRLHATPNRSEVVACNPWLEAELAVVKPRLVVALGSTAAKAFLGPAFGVLAQRGKLLEAPGGRSVVATVHPSSILRSRDDASRHAAMAAFVADLAAVAKLLRA
jgi:uracil-DNA glycosylase